MVKKDIEVFYWLQRCMDFVLPAASVYFAFLWFYADETVSQAAIDLALMLGALFVLVSQLTGLYRSTDLWYQKGFEKLVIKSWLITVLIQFFIVDQTQFNNAVYYSLLLAIPVLLWFYRYLVYHFLQKLNRRGNQRRRVAILGAGKVGRLVAQNIQQSLLYAVNLVAFFDDDKALINQHIESLPVLSNLDDIALKLAELECNEVFICLPVSSEPRIREVLDSLANSSVVVKFVPNLFSFDLLNASWHDFFGLPVISVYDTPLNSMTNLFIKRIEDILLSLFAIMVSAPVMLFIALLIRLTSNGPIVYQQVRYGLNGRPITVYKFRTMYVDSDQSLMVQATKNDRRVTRFGKWLRRTSLDELPQFFNVLRGEMSIVGPRPHAAEHNEFYRNLVPKYMQRHMVKPGITGLAQVNGFRGQTEQLEKMEKRVEFDLHYIRTWSLWLDLKIFLLTFLKGIIHDNAY
ncbi:undecaprenyl-phosphate glucose phosphotransferase [Thiosulfatimonas sediminis]|uniref:Undecaprenyl-phosphate glucose phosphotransferase n=1 Tax=Thiosulfatimonas sediminis TaxID=2675054 RepID=A0A6F8PSZ3_9GAMM|nr:undecaprenyl-phosphate glucose phosphotransferase [Thiosulfatimonas sediminis]BBP45138.1 undecaprenyl-phosphate glucose phosphotransferase [Thiosulfatimonas sediminis]